jgi:hypothetical protein
MCQQMYETLEALARKSRTVIDTPRRMDANSLLLLVASCEIIERVVAKANVC